MKRRMIYLVAACLIAIGVLGDRLISIGSGSPPAVAAASTTSSTTNVSASAIDQATEQAYATASKSVVYVVSKGLGTGSGIIYDTNGDIVTNDHVIDGAHGITVTLNDGTTHSATVVGTDKADDLAVIRIHAPDLTAAHFATAGGYQVAQTVLAIGSPLGLQQSVTSGMISGLNRVQQEPNGAYIANAIQTSAPINPGNSGGALVTLDGTVVGIPTVEQTSAQDGTSAQDIGFAVPAERITLVTDQIIASGKVTHTDRPYLGIAPGDPSASETTSQWGFGQGQITPTTTGAIVSQLSSSGPAAKAGVQQDDVITAIDGKSVTDAQSLLSVLTTKKPGDTVTLKLDRNGSTMTVQVKLGELPA